eukprot:Sdes_comp9438_c0_seq1m902
MSQKQPKPTLTGQRIRTRKRDEKEKYDPESFRDSVISTLKELNNQSEEIIKALDKLGNTLDYHRYGDVLFDILIVGGLLSQGGKVILEDGAEISPYCIVGGPSTDEGLKEYVTVFAKIIRRYKYLQRNLGDVCVKLVKFLKCFEKEEIQKFARSLGLFIAMSLVNLEPILEALSSEHLVKEGISIEFISIVLKTWLNESKIGPVAAALKKSEFEFQLRNLLPASKRTHEALINHFANDEKLQPIAQFYKQIESHGVKSKFSKTLQQMIEREASVSKIVSVSRGFLGAGNNLLTPVELVCLIWDAGMESVEWNKKPDLLQEQALKHVKVSLLCLLLFSIHFIQILTRIHFWL